MPSDCISYQESGYFIPLIVDYLNQKPQLQQLYHRFPSADNFERQFAEKQSQFSDSSRKVLVSALERQYESIAASTATKQNIHQLLDKNTFTITTGHQLNLFTGPLYFLYKIVSAVNLTKELKMKYPRQNFVPIYWMATEDHDFEEIKSDGDLPEGWEPACLPYSKYSHMNAPEDLINKTIKELI